MKVSFTIHQSLALLLCFSLWAKHGSHSSGFSSGILFVKFWLADDAQVTAGPEPSVVVRWRAESWSIVVVHLWHPLFTTRSLHAVFLMTWRKPLLPGAEQTPHSTKLQYCISLFHGSKLYYKRSAIISRVKFALMTFLDSNNISNIWILHQKSKGKKVCYNFSSSSLC